MHLLVMSALIGDSRHKLTTACLLVALTLRRMIGLFLRSRDSLECWHVAWCCRIGHALIFRRLFTNQQVRRLGTFTVKHLARCCLIIVAERCYSRLPLASHRRSLLTSSYYDWRWLSIRVRSTARKKYSQLTCIRIRALIRRQSTCIARWSQIAPCVSSWETLHPGITRRWRAGSTCSDAALPWLHSALQT